MVKRDYVTGTDEARDACDAFAEKLCAQACARTLRGAHHVLVGLVWGVRVVAALAEEGVAQRREER